MLLFYVNKRILECVSANYVDGRLQIFMYNLCMCVYQEISVIFCGECHLQMKAYKRTYIIAHELIEMLLSFRKM